MDIRKLIDKRSVQLKKGLLTEAEIKKLVTEWRDEQSEEDLAQATIDREVKTMEEKLSKYNVSQLGDIPIKREDGSFRILVCQIEGMWPRHLARPRVAHKISPMR